MLKKMVITLLYWLVFSSLSHASIETYQFDTQQQSDDYDELIFELRCLVCQNQNLADSNAELAQDLRQKVHHMLVEEKATKAEIVSFMVARYGEFVLYKPPVNDNTYLLWVGPFFLLAIGLWMAVRFVRGQANLNENEEREQK